MANSDLFLSTKLNALHSAFTNNYLLKHGNIFMKPEIPVNGFPYTFFPGDLGFNGNNGLGAVPGIVSVNDAPLDFAIKHEKPPTPPASTSPVNSKTPPPQAEDKNATDSSKNASWILGTQKLSWDNSTVASYNPETKMFRCVVCNAVGFLSRIAEHYLGTHTSAKVFQCLHCPYSSTWSRCVRMHMAKHHGVPNAPPSLWKGQPLLEEIFQLLTNLKTTVDSQGRDRTDPEVCDKKFICPKCPYTTDRRDLYLRHENIHKEDKPYHCYICFKLFNRADHVKKHFLRIHRGHPYDISLVRRRPPRVSGSSYSSSSGKNLNGASKVTTPSGDIPSSKAGAGVQASALKDSNGALPRPSNGFNQAKGFDCPFCSWEGADAWCLRRHMSTHVKTYGCPVCDFKSSKAERLFTHVYKFHGMLVCTKCKYLTDQAHHFENHIKECCVEIVLGPQVKQNADDSAIDSDSSHSPGVKKPTEPAKVPTQMPADHAGLTGNFNPSDVKASISIIPLHNSISYCFPVQQSTEGLGNAFGSCNASSARDSKIEIKTELASPAQSSSDSGLADFANDQNELDLTCWHCGCEFADESSLNTHTELYHRNESSSKTSECPRPKRKFSCALCNFSSNDQKTILDHMRFHTGETLVCRAEKSCAFATIFDATLSEHVLSQHRDGQPRCPHCGLPCGDRVAFIRHYRHYHHSTSCYRCRDLKHGYESAVVQPYLCHNPYSKSKSGHRTTPAEPSSSGATDLTASKGRRARKQSTPRKFVHPLPKSCDTNKHRTKRQSHTFLQRYIVKLQKQHQKPVWFCKLCKGACYRNRANFILHSLWYHRVHKFECKSCNEKFKCKYQLFLHKKKVHESPIT